jgi:Trk K+ transport system NAD-binding subunit
VPVVAIDRDPRAPGVREARFAGAQVLLGDGHDQAILREAEIGHARSLVAAMPDGIESLKIILATARANPALATVQRLSSEGLVYSIHTNLNDGGKPGRVQHTSIDAAHIAAEFFATQFGTTTVIDMINVQNRLAVIAEVPVAESSELEEVTVADVDENRMFQVLAVQRQDKDVQWNPHSDFLVHSGDTLLILAALDHLWQVAARARPSNWHS